ncbi:MAG: sterol desaturase family protein [Myxococcaceae bacterium]|nr:sterol desaturase family protein [Myxococcaceae bacterium]MCI0673522.1 sterol desaturase family protein [Myxococcaceae bacterium]
MNPTILPASVARFRDEYREKHIGRWYRGWGHLAFTLSGSLSIVVFALSRLRDVTLLEWAVVPAAFFIANVGEYFGHKGPMHRPVRGLGLLFQRHTQQHHHFFTHEAMAYESSRDFKMVLFPPVMLLFFLGALASPIGALFFLLGSPNAGWLFVATALAYFLTYEVLHWSYHLPATHPVARLAPIRTLGQHHTRHHDLRLMGRCNFNITFPICDWLFGTTWRPQAVSHESPQSTR